MAMVEWDQLVVDVFVTTRGQRAMMSVVDMLIEELQKKEVSPRRRR